MLVFFSVFVLYLVTLCPTIYVGDSPLFASASFSLGTAHPPGYPFYILLGKLGTLLPLGNIAFKVNLVNATFGGLSALMTYKVVYYLTDNKYAAWSSALFLAVVPVFWTGAINAKGVYSLNTFLCMIIFLLIVKMLRSDGSLFRQLMLVAFLLGLGMGNHQTIGLMGLSAVPVFLIKWRKIRMRWVPLAVIFLLAGLSVNLLIYVRSRVAVTSGIDILYSYGGTFEALKNVFLRKAYKVNSVVALKHGTWGVIPHFLAVTVNVLKNILVPNVKYGIPLIALGLFGAFRDRKLLAYIGFLLFLWITFLGSVSAGTSLTEEGIQVISVYYAPLYAFMAVLLGLGVALVLEKAAAIWKGSGFVPRFLAYSAVAFPLCLAPQAYAFAAPVQYPLAYTWARDMLVTLPVGSMLLNYNDNPTFTSFYMLSVEKFRDDVLQMDAGGTKDNYGLETAPVWKYGGLYPDFYRAENVKVSYLDRKFALKGRFFTSNPKDMTPVLKKHYSFRVVGLTSELFPKGAVPGPDVIDSRSLKANKFLNYEFIRNLPYIDDFLAVELVNHYALCLLIYGDAMNERGDLQAGRKAILESISLGDPKVYLGPYIKYLMDEGMTGKGLDFLRKLERKGDERQRAVANILEYKVLSVIGNREEAERKYEFVKEEGFAKFLNVHF